MTILILCALASLVARSDSMDTKGLLQVHLLYRHGDRTPIAAYPTDPYKNYSWPGGWGQLTVAGRDEQVFCNHRYFVSFNSFIS